MNKTKNKLISFHHLLLEFQHQIEVLLSSYDVLTDLYKLSFAALGWLTAVVKYCPAVKDDVMRLYEHIL